MPMSFWFGNAVSDLLFKGYTITSNIGFISTCFGLASLAILFEAIKVYQASLKQEANSVLKASIQNEERCPSERSSLISSNQGIPKMSKKNFMYLVYQMVWYVMQNVLGYILMLCVMTYNGYFFIAVCLGAGLGYLIFGSRLLQIGLETGGIIGPKRECPVCIRNEQTSENNQQGSSIMSEIAQGVVQSVMLDPKEEAAACTSTAEVHNVQ